MEFFLMEFWPFCYQQWLPDANAIRRDFRGVKDQSIFENRFDDKEKFSVVSIMDHPFTKSVSITVRQSRLMEMIESNDSLAILIQADPDAMASALALKRLFWRKIKKIEIYRINEIKRADNRHLFIYSM